MGSPCYHHSCIALKHGSLQLNSAVCSHKVTLLPPDCQLTEYGSVLLRVLSIWFLVQALMCFNQSGAGIRNCTRPRWVWKSITRLSKKKKYPVYIYNHGSQFFWKIQRKLPGLCWVFHDIRWFFDSFFANTQTWWFFDPDFFLQIPRTSSYYKNERPAHTGFNVFCSSAVQQLDPIVVTILCCLSSSLQDLGLAFRVWDFNTQYLSNIGWWGIVIQCVDAGGNHNSKLPRELQSGRVGAPGWFIPQVCSQRTTFPHTQPNWWGSFD